MSSSISQYYPLIAVGGVGLLGLVGLGALMSYNSSKISTPLDEYSVPPSLSWDNTYAMRDRVDNPPPPIKPYESYSSDNPPNVIKPVMVGGKRRKTKSKQKRTKKNSKRRH